MLTHARRTEPPVAGHNHSNYLDRVFTRKNSRQRTPTARAFLVDRPLEAVRGGRARVVGEEGAKDDCTCEESVDDVDVRGWRAHLRER